MPIRLCWCLEFLLRWTMNPKSIDMPLFQTVERIVVAVPAGGFRNLAARHTGHASNSFGSVNSGMPFTK